MEELDPMNIPFVFKDISCSRPANLLLAQWLDFMLENYPDDLHWLYRRSQEYVKHGGGSIYTFPLWKKRTRKNVNIALEEYT